VKKRILRAAAKSNGELSEDAMIAEAGGREAFVFAASSLVSERKALKQKRGSADIYIFPEFQFQLKFKTCPYCGSDYPVRGTVENCPSCGGDLKVKSGNDSSGDDKFSMDIE
jgi:rRNA maturation protein Nop10